MMYGVRTVGGSRLTLMEISWCLCVDDQNISARVDGVSRCMRRCTDGGLLQKHLDLRGPLRTIHNFSVRLIGLLALVDISLTFLGGTFFRIRQLTRPLLRFLYSERRLPPIIEGKRSGGRMRIQLQYSLPQLQIFLCEGPAFLLAENSPGRCDIGHQRICLYLHPVDVPLDQGEAFSL